MRTMKARAVHNYAIHLKCLLPFLKISFSYRPWIYSSFSFHPALHLRALFAQKKPFSSSSSFFLLLPKINRSGRIQKL